MFDNVTYILQYEVDVLEQEAGVVNTFHPGISAEHKPDVPLWDQTDLGIMLEELNHPVNVRSHVMSNVRHYTYNFIQQFRCRNKSSVRPGGFLGLFMHTMVLGSLFFPLQGLSAIP